MIYELTPGITIGMVCPIFGQAKVKEKGISQTFSGPRDSGGNFKHHTNKPRLFTHWHYFLIKAGVMKQRINRQALIKKILYVSAFFLAQTSFSQKTLIVDSSHPHFRTVIAGKEYKSSNWHETLWGEDYRPEWSTPVTVPVLNLDSAYGGLTPIKEGGGRQTKSLRLKDATGRQFVLRSVNKTYTGALPEVFRGTFIEEIMNDQIATNHPYAALAVPHMAEATGVYHTNPKYYLVPYHERLGEFNETFANTLCLLEERPDESQVKTESFGYPEDIVSTEDMYEKMAEENDHLMDQNHYVMTRLFDIFVGDWGRHPDNWRWAKFDSGSYKIYRPVLKDRDQTWAKFEGILFSIGAKAAGLKQLQSFDDNIKDIRWYNYAPNELDKRFANQITRAVWIDSAKALQRYMTNHVIENAVKQMPPEIFVESGEETIRILKARRDKLVDYAGEYYDFLAKEIDIAGSKQNEVFKVERLNDHETLVTVYPVNKNGKVSKNPSFSRIFNSGETKEVRLYGIDGHDVFHVYGNADNKIKIRVIGGRDSDTVINESSKIYYYDNPGNIVSGKMKKYVSNGIGINAYNYQRRDFDKKGWSIIPNYANVRGIFFEFGYKSLKHKWRTAPFASQQSIKGIYSISNKSLGGEYVGIFNEAIGKWNIVLNGSYDQTLQYYFFGLGNETENKGDIEYYRTYTTEGKGGIGLNRNFARHSSITMAALYEYIKPQKKPYHLSSETVPLTDETAFTGKNFLSAVLSYSYYNINDEVVPTKGIGITLNASHTKNLSQSDRWFNKYWTTVGFFLPFNKTFSLASRNGFSTLEGKPEFYQYNWVGGGQNLRGHRRQRFAGETSIYTSNELRWITDMNGYWLKGKIGLIGFVDQGRVWMQDDPSDKWHVGYGGGLLLSPFNKIAVTVYYGISEDERLIHLRLGRFF